MLSVSFCLLHPMHNMYSAPCAPCTLQVVFAVDGLVHAIVSLPLLNVKVGILRTLLQSLVVTRLGADFAADEWRELNIDKLVQRTRLMAEPSNRSFSRPSMPTLKSFRVSGTAYVRTLFHSIEYPPYFVWRPIEPVRFPL